MPPPTPRGAVLAARACQPPWSDQTDRLVALGYPALAGLDEEAFRALVAPLTEVAARTDAPYVLVVTRDVVRPEDTVPLLTLDGGSRPGRVDRNHGEGDLATYHPLPELDVPTGSGVPACSTWTGARSSAASARRTPCR